MSPSNGNKAQAKKRGTTRAKKARKAAGGKKAGARKPPLPPVDDSAAFRSAAPRPTTPMPRDATDDASPNEGFGS